MKKICTLIPLLLFVLIAVHAQQLKTVEYFFDQDPGVGKGTDITLNSASVDSTINFNANSLSYGVHTLYTRLKNSANSWSTLYQSSILITNGIAGTPTITVAEYFYDKDPGYGKGKQLPLDSTTLNSNLGFNLDGLTNGQHILYVRLKDNSNAWSTVYQGSFLLSTGGSGTAQILTAEYFFDTDPGFGNGKQISLNNGSLDSTFNFSITGLSTGVHTFFVRFKNNSNNWSYANQGNFVVTSGTSGTPLITSLEYFLDTDKGIKQDSIITLKNTASLDTTLSIPIVDNGGDKRTLGLRLTDQTGQTGNVALSDISLCNLYKPTAGFRYAQYAGTFTLIDTSSYNPTKKIRWLVNDVLTDSSYSINYQFLSSLGSSKIAEIAGTGCRVDTAVQTLNLPGVESYQPLEGAYNSDFTLTIYGLGLDTGMTIYLKRGDTVLYPYLKYTTDGQRMLAIFNLHNYPLNEAGDTKWDVFYPHIKYSNGYEYTGTDGISLVSSYNKNACRMYYNDVAAGIRPVQNGEINIAAEIDEEIAKQFRCPPGDPVNHEEPYFATDLTGGSTLRSGVWNNLNISVTNTGSQVGKEIPVYVLIPANFDIDTSVWHIVGNYSKLQDSMSIIVPVIDTVILGKKLQYNLVGLMEPILGPGETQNISLRIRTNQLGDGDIYYWAAQRYFGSANLLLGPCTGAAVDHAIGYIPILGALNAAWDWGWSVGTAVTNYEFHVLYGDPWNPSQDLGSIALNSAGVLFAASTGGGGSSIAKGSFTTMVKDMAANKTETVIVNSLSGTGSAVLALGADQISDDPCIKLNQNGTPKKKPVTTRGAFDPNHIYGNSDYDTAKNYINNYSPQFYTVTFENKPKATANAQHVYITNTLNPKKFDLHTFKISRFTIGDSTYNVPTYRTQATKDVAIKGRKDMRVRFAASFDTTKGVLRADFFSIDSAGHVLPTDSLAGFLPPNIDGVSGSAGLSYSVYVRNLNTLDTFANKAVIYFDNNAGINTNNWMNTVDTTAPVSKIYKVIRVNDSTAKMVIQHSDIGSGYWYSTLYVKGPADTSFHRMLVTASDTIIITGKLNKTYQFYTGATDHVSNQEVKTKADVTYIFATTLPVTLLSFTGAKIADSVRLNWVTTDELNLYGYEVEKSADAQNFTTMASVRAQGNKLTNDYVLYDGHPYAKSNYYRLKEIDLDGKFTYSNIVRIDFDKKYTLNMSPVPAHDYVLISGAENFTNIQFIDVNGKLVKQFTQAPGNRFNIADLAPGMYFVRLSSGEDLKVLKLIKQ